MAYKKIMLSTALDEPVIDNLLVDAAITPGHLCERTATGAKKHATAGGTQDWLIALENTDEGEGIATALAADEEARFWTPQRGDKAYMLLADGETAAIGNYLESYGDGTLRVVDTDASAGEIALQSIVGRAETAVDMSGSAGEDPSGRIVVRIS